MLLEHAPPFGAALVFNWVKIRTFIRSRFLARGEKSIIWIGVATASILIGAAAANAWWTFNVAQDAQINCQVNELRDIGMALSRSAEILLSSGELSALRRMVIDSTKEFHIERSRIVLGPDQILADSRPADINQFQLPARWPSTPLDPQQAPTFTTHHAGDGSSPARDESIQFRYPLHVEGRGTAFLEISAPAMPSWPLAKLAMNQTNLIGAAGLALLFAVYRRQRKSLAAQESVVESVSAYSGPEDCASLAVDPHLGPTAQQWNKLLGDMDELRRQTAIARANNTGGRRTNPSGLDSACDAMSQGLILIDERLRVRFANGAASVLLNTPRENLVGTPIEDLVTDEKLRQAIRAIVCEKSRRPVTVEIERGGEAGGGVLRFSVRPVRKGDPDASTLIVEDVTQQRTAERARNSFINQVTHELRTPLTNIRLYAENAIEHRDSDPTKFSNCLNVINQESRRLERIVTAMLSVAEMEAGSSTLHKDDVRMDALFNDLRADYKAQAEEKNITIEFVLPPKLPVIMADRDKLAIALHNLVGNALKYTPGGGKVTVTADVRDGHIVVDVADSGIGIAPAELELIFDKFTRSKDPRVAKIVGTGLGLTLAREVMRLHGGDISVQSELNRGSTFTATLPTAVEAA
jgi:PAS domain S-box-containing protein